MTPVNDTSNVHVKPVRVGVIGLGLIAQVAHLPALRSLGDRVHVSHLCDLSEGLATETAGDGWADAKVETDWTRLVNADLDAVVVCTPGSHGRIARSFLEVGTHVLAEKPLCLSQAACGDLAMVAHANGARLQVGYMKIHEPMVRAARIASTSIGALRHVRITVMHPADEPQVGHLSLRHGGAVDENEIAVAHDYERAESADAIGDAPVALRDLYTEVMHGSVVHQMALLRALTGTTPDEWPCVIAAPFSIEDPTAEPPSIQAMTTLDGGPAISLSWNWVPGYPTYREEVEIIGADGSVHLALSPPYAYEPPVLTVTTEHEGREQTVVSRAGHIDAFRHQMLAFIDGITGDRPTCSGADDALADVVTLQAMLATIARARGYELGGETRR